MIMKIVVVGGTGLIGSKLLNQLREHGHEAVAAAPSTGVNTVTGVGMAEALKGALVVVDVSNAPDRGDTAVMRFFETSTRSLLTCEAASIPYSILRATQVFESVKSIADLSTDGNKVRLPSVLIQPMAADDVAGVLGEIAMGPPVNGTVEVGGPERFHLDELVRQAFAGWKDPREVITDPRGCYYDIDVKERTLVPEDNARLGTIRFEDWLAQRVSQIREFAA
jgi:uncharacterized protein YbjT (DUF2867 family)